MAYRRSGEAVSCRMREGGGDRRIEDLFSSVPAQLLDPALDLPPALSEQELVADLERLAARNRPLSAWESFLGAGVYRRFIPAIVRGTTSRPEFYTAYTPYQAEASQGTLQTIFEFQTMICALTGLDVANASLYDGATAAAEALMLAVSQTGRKRVAVSAAIHPEALKVIETYAHGRGVAVDVVPHTAGVTPLDAVHATLTQEHAGLIVAQPSFFGALEDLAPLADAAHAHGALAIASVDPIACTVLVPPGEAGFDVAVGDGQPLGIPASYGGPHVGFIATTDALVRRLPGRPGGKSVDPRGRPAYTLTPQAREPHNRREQATPHTCPNHAPIAPAATNYIAKMGAGG